MIGKSIGNFSIGIHHPFFPLGFPDESPDHPEMKQKGMPLLAFSSGQATLNSVKFVSNWVKLC